MDLGFGNQNQVVGDVASTTILKTAQAQEQAIDAEISKYDELLNNDDALESLRAKRLDQMKAAARTRQIYIENGHGTYVSLGEGRLGSDIAREFFEASKASERLVVHFYRPTTRFCDVFHSHLQKLAHKHLETRFVKINVEETENSGVSFLVERLGIIIMPTILIVKDRKARHQIRGFDELGGTENFTTTLLACVLATHGAIHLTEDERDHSGEFLEKLMDD
jgi:hypothetical protein